MDQIIAAEQGAKSDQEQIDEMVLLSESPTALDQFVQGQEGG